MSDLMLEIMDLSIGIRNNKKFIPFSTDISLGIKKGEIFGVVGESGCGKSILALSIAGLLPENVKVLSGSIIFDKTNLLNLNKSTLRKMLGNDISMVFQEPLTSLNPLMKVGKQVSECLKLHTDLTHSEIKIETLNILKQVGLSDPEKIINCYPHQLSGGMRQRVMIAIAISCKPKLIIADEPTTALDVTIQFQILKLLLDINKLYGCTIILISHDLGVITSICNRVAVMYAGNIVEEGDTKSVFSNPQHEYTKGLVASIPTREKRGQRLENIDGRVPAATEKKTGCSFANRCKKASENCFFNNPQFSVVNQNHKARCIFAENKGDKK